MYFSKALAGNEEDGLTEYVCCSLERDVQDDEECVIIGTINFFEKECYISLYFFKFNIQCVRLFMNTSNMYYQQCDFVDISVVICICHSEHFYL